MHILHEVFELSYKILMFSCLYCTLFGNKYSPYMPLHIKGLSLWIPAGLITSSFPISTILPISVLLKTTRL